MLPARLVENRTSSSRKPRIVLGSDMLISHRYKFIYTKTVKTAGTSVESYFERFCMPEGEWTPAHFREKYESPAGIIGYRGSEPVGDRKWYNHMPAERIKTQIGDETWKRYFKFCVIRNPFEKALSAFAHFGKNHSIPGGPGGLWFRLTHRSCSGEQLRFLHWLTFHGPPIDRDKFTIHSKLCLNDLIRYESLAADMERICKSIGVSWEPALLPEFKSGIRSKDCTSSQLYTPPALRLVAKAYAFEIAAFGYTPPRLGNP